ncbi:AraC family transcriptional regulator [Mangrovimonas sp. TPBH4]|uniref:helix-turn-helix domain-containing protein n=1 Tax=Mangrovimonas sp. TPBH4 TaxID=1645914 RepID=UPI0006B48CA0|nr:AraC family transcriptional regulator [Mangrovimonas sp. TPBH4]
MKTKAPSTISYPLMVPTEWYQFLEHQHLGSIDQETFVFDPSIGQGHLQYMEFQKGFWAQQMNFTLKDPFDITQTAGTTNDLFIVSFYLTKAPISQQIDEKKFEFNFDSISIMLSSSASISLYHIPANEEVKIFQIGFTRDWLLANAFEDSNPNLKRLFVSDDPIYMAENLDYQFKYLVKEMDLLSSNRLLLFSGSLQLLNTLFTKFENRQLNSSQHSNIHHNDLESLLQVRTLMDENPLQPISLDELAQQSGMSLSKFKRYFKQVYGLSPYQYHLQNKLAVGLDRLHQNYSVSEVAFLLGYNNLSHFSKAFKKHYGFLPSNVQKDS